MNEKIGKTALQWQRGYGAVSFGRHDLSALMKYVSNQKEHHARGSINKTLELHGTYLENEPEDENP